MWLKNISLNYYYIISLPFVKCVYPWVDIPITSSVKFSISNLSWLTAWREYSPISSIFKWLIFRIVRLGVNLITYFGLSESCEAPMISSPFVFNLGNVQIILKDLNNIVHINIHSINTMKYWIIFQACENDVFKKLLSMVTYLLIILILNIYNNNIYKVNI